MFQFRFNVPKYYIKNCSNNNAPEILLSKTISFEGSIVVCNNKFPSKRGQGSERNLTYVVHYSTIKNPHQKSYSNELKNCHDEF